MKEQYLDPEMEIILFDDTNIITNSPETNGQIITGDPNMP